MFVRFFFFRNAEQIVPDLMFYHDRNTEQYTDDAKMHHFLDMNLFRAKPRVSREEEFIICAKRVLNDLRSIISLLVNLFRDKRRKFELKLKIVHFILSDKINVK